MSAPEEPVIAVGLLDDEPTIHFQLHGEFTLEETRELVPAGVYQVERRAHDLVMSGPKSWQGSLVTLVPAAASAHFRLTTEIGRDFHWAEYEEQQFAGTLRVIGATRGAGLTAINLIPTEAYLTSVICSEMSSSSPRPSLEAHAVISRSWLLARRQAKREASAAASTRAVASGATVAVERADKVIRWYDNNKHADFDVCAEDHCQRYHGTARIAGNSEAAEAIAATRGQVLMHAGHVCETVYSKCCGGISEDARVAWGDEEVAYLKPVADVRPSSPSAVVPTSMSEAAFEEHLRSAKDAYCRCEDEAVLHTVLPPRDQRTRHFFRWQERLTPDQASQYVRDKLGIDLGPLRAIEPLKRGVSGRLEQVRLVGAAGTLIVGKELEIRRVLSSTHLYSSAFSVEVQGPPDAPDAFVLHGAGWGHGVGLCQVGAAVMGHEGRSAEEILHHYYPGTTLERAYL
ncbi:MAG: SpoIID/LytB domain-containing protein [Pseudomonadota bacterium]